MDCKRAKAILDNMNLRKTLDDMTQQEGAELMQIGASNILSEEQFKSLSDEVSKLAADQSEEMSDEMGLRKERVDERVDEKKEHGMAFHLRSEKKKDEIRERVAKENEIIGEYTEKISNEQKGIAELISKKTVLESLYKNANSYVGITTTGKALLSNLTLKMYRVSEMTLDEYQAQEKAIEDELTAIAKDSVGHFERLKPSMEDVDETHLWSVCVGLSKIDGDSNAMDEKFVSAYRFFSDESKNSDNVMMGAEMLSESQLELDKAFDDIEELKKRVHKKLHVAKESAVGVASMLFIGMNRAGEYPLDRLENYMRITPSTDAATVMAIVDKPVEDVNHKFDSMRNIFQVWGYEQSEDTELASAYLAISEIPAEGFQTKLGIIIEGVKNYLEYPLVASAILAEISVFEANEALNLLSRSYTILGRYIRGLDQPELIGLAVRAVHGMRNETIKKLDTTAKIKNTPVQFTYRPYGSFMPYYIGFACVHSGYFSTFSSIGGAHPGHIHVSGGTHG